MNNYLIPANSKKSMLYFGVFNDVDLWIFGIGVGVTLFLLMVLPVGDLIPALIAISPGLICGFLVLPIPNYHNVRTFIKSVYIFYISDRKLVWKGWCLSNDENDKR